MAADKCHEPSAVKKLDARLGSGSEKGLATALACFCSESSYIFPWLDVQTVGEVARRRLLGDVRRDWEDDDVAGARGVDSIDSVGLQAVVMIPLTCLSVSSTSTLYQLNALPKRHLMEF